MRWPLRYQILVPFAAVMLISLAGVSLLDAYLAARWTEQHIQAQLREMAETLLDSTFPLTDRVLHQTHGLSGADFVLTDADGRLLAASLPFGSLRLPKGKVAAGETFHLGPVEDIAGERYFHSVVAMRERGGETAAGQLHILYPEQVLREARWQAIYPPLLVGGLALGGVIVLAVAIAGRVSRPILQLRAQVGRLAQGDFQPVTLPYRNDELRDLVGSVNLLASQLDELQRVIKRTERLTLLGQLSGGLAHHLRNNVTGARIAMQLHHRHCREIDQESLAVALRQLTLTEEHLQRFLAAGQPQPVRLVTCDLEQVLDGLLPLVAPAGRHRRVALGVSQRQAPANPGDLQDPADAVDIAGHRAPLRADPEQLRQLLLNLMLNGVEAAGPGGWVRIEWFGTTINWHVCVFDSGAGPPQQLVERLFEAFVTSKPEGVGLGLAVARQIAEAHGGTLEYCRDEHTCFELILPRCAVAEGPVNANPVTSTGASDSLATYSARQTLTPAALESPINHTVRP